jgi:hypothetical protein
MEKFLDRPLLAETSLSIVSLLATPALSRRRPELPRNNEPTPAVGLNELSGGGGNNVFVRLQQPQKLYLLENQMFVEAPRTAAPLVLEIYPPFLGTRMPKGLPEHGQVIFIGAKANNMSDAYSLRIPAF